MPSSPRSRQYVSNNKKDEQGSTTRSQNGSDFLDNPFRSLPSTIAFFGLCAFVATSVYILLKKYCQFRKYKSSPFHARIVPNHESARALSNDIDVGQPWTWQTESELATADLVEMREGATVDDGEVSPVGMFPFEDTESDKGYQANYGLQGGLEGRRSEGGTTQEEYFTPANSVVDENEALWADHKQAGEELDQMRRNLRSGMIRPSGVVVGQVGDSGIARRRRATLNRSM